jgi:hypothetical protein
MLETKTSKVLTVLAVGLLFFPSCSSDGTGVEPGSASVNMTGDLSFPAGDQVDLEEVSVGLGSSKVSPDSDGTFSIEGTRSITSAAIAYNPDTLPMLMSIVADPQEGAHFGMDVHSTALALAFLCPFVCVADPEDAEEVLSLLEGLPEMDELEDLLETRLAADQFALSVEDAETDSAVSRLVLAYMTTYPSTIVENYPSLGNAAEATRSSAAPVLYIDPSYEKSGHRITYTSGIKFMVTNSLGRWAYCVTPTDSFYVFPNGTLLDAIRLNPFKPSEREFELSVIVNEPPQEVTLYGFGMAPDADNNWDDLGPREQTRARYGGWSTFFFEFVPHVVSVITGANKAMDNKEIAEHHAFKFMQLLSTDARMMDRTQMYIREGNMWGMGWFYTKWGIKKLLTRDSVGEALAAAWSMVFTVEDYELLVANMNVAVRVAVTSDAVASVIKTLIGYRNSRYKTTFKIWAETTGFGNISGSVHDEDDGLAISGVHVVVQGDEGNPMNPSHEYTTGETGAFYFENIMEGQKTLDVSKAGYGTKSVGVNVKSGMTVNVNVSLSKDTGRVQGKVLNEILRWNSVDPSTFQDACNLDVEEIGGTGQTLAYVLYDGEYAKDLAPGNWRLIASHDLYWPDTVEVTVESEDIIDVDDLVLYPRGRMNGEISLDMDGNGTWEKQSTFTAFMTAAGFVNPTPHEAGGSATGSYLEVLATAVEFGSATYEYIFMDIDLGLVDGPDYYNLGGYGEVTSPAYSVPAGVYYLMNKEKCYHPDAGYMPMSFLVSSEPSIAPCNCEIVNFGSLVLEEFGTELTDVLSGGISADLAGWNTCDCYCCEDVDGDGQEDDWVVDCARARLSLDFEVIVGSLMSQSVREKASLARERRAREVQIRPSE